MRTALLAAVVAAACYWCSGAEYAIAGGQTQDQKAGAQQNPTTDPAKMAQPAPVPGAKPSGSAPVAPVGKDYVIGPEDVIRVSVWEEGRFSGSFVVLTDGRINMPLAGPIVAAGLTQGELEGSIIEALKKCCLQDPHPNVQVEAVHSKKIYFDGDGIRTGSMDYVIPIKLLEAISSNGGFKDFADKKHIRILRDGRRFETISYSDVISGKHPEKNILLLPGDHVIVN